MYATANPIKKLVEAAEASVVVLDRAKYKPFIVATEQYAIDRELIVGGTVGYKILCGDAPDKDSYNYDIYTAKPIDDGKALADIFYAVAMDGGDQHGFAALINANIEYNGLWTTVSVDGRPLVKFIKMGNFRKVPLAKLFNPDKRPALFLAPATVPVLSPEIYLIKVYRALSAPCPAPPSAYEKYTALVDKEARLFDMVGPSLAERITRGGRRHHRDGPRAGPPAAAIVDALAARYGPAIVFVRGRKLSWLAAADPEDVVVALAAATRARVHYMDYDLKIPGDPALRKYSFYSVAGDTRTPIGDMYNVTTYEAIPFVHGRAIDAHPKIVRVAMGWAQLRIRMVELYALRIIHSLGGGNKQMFDDIADAIVEERRAIIGGADPLWPAPTPDNYVGVCIAERMIIKGLLGPPVFQPKYFPSKKRGDEVSADGD